MHKKQSQVLGFTLVELMVTLGIAALILTLAIPSFQTMISDNRMTIYTNELIGAMMLAKSEAVKRGIQTSVFRRGGVPGAWEFGWDVVVDADGDNAFDPAVAALCLPNQDCLIRSHDPLATGYTMRTGGSTYQDRATYLPSGLGNVPGDTFTITDGTQDSTRFRNITLNNIGRANTCIGAITPCP